MKLKLLSAFVLAGLAMVTQQAFAADGQITFNGTIASSTCAINGGTGANLTVTLPTVSTSTLNAAGAAAGRTAFQISLTGCAATTPVHAYFEQGPNAGTAGRLKTTLANLDIRLVNGDGTTNIDTSAADGAQSSASVTTDGTGAATLKYFAEYYANAAGIAAGSVTSSVLYTVKYN